MTWDPSPELVEAGAQALAAEVGVPHHAKWYRGSTTTVLRAAVDSGDLIPRERVEELVEALRELAESARLVARLADPPIDLWPRYLHADARALALYTQEPKG